MKPAEDAQAPAARIEAAAIDLAMVEIFDTIEDIAAAIEVEHAVPAGDVREYLAAAVALQLIQGADVLPHLPAPVRLALVERAFLRRFGVPMSDATPTTTKEVFDA